MTNPFAMFAKANLATVDALLRKIESEHDPHKLDLWFMALAAAGDAPGMAGAKAQEGFMCVHDRVPVYGVHVHDAVRVSKVAQQRRVEAAYELAVLERDHPTLYAELQATLSMAKASVVAVGRDDALHQMEARVQAFINSRRPTPRRAAPGQRPTPVAPVPTKAQAWDWLMHNDREFQRLYGIYSGRP